MWTSSLRLRGGVLGTGACLAALACAANGWAAGGTPMPAPDDPPPAYQTSTVKTSAPTTAPKAPRAKRVAEPAPRVPTPDAPISAASTTTAKAAHREAGRGSGARSLSERGVGIVHPECLDIAACEYGWHRAREDSRPSLDVHSAAFGAEAESEAKPKAQQKTAVTKAKRTVTPPDARPRDAVRLGLPVGALAPRAPGGDGMEGGLLVAAALLLAAAAGGSLLLGVAARTATRHA